MTLIKELNKERTRLSRQKVMISEIVRMIQSVEMM